MHCDFKGQGEIEREAVQMKRNRERVKVGEKERERNVGVAVLSADLLSYKRLLRALALNLTSEDFEE